MRAPTRHLVSLHLAAALAGVAFSVAPLAIAGKGGAGAAGGGKPSGSAGTATIAIAEGYADPRTNGTVAFAISTTATTQPYVNLKCSQGGVVVYDGYEGYFEHALDDGIFRLASNGWNSGDADCTATVVKYSSKGWQPLGSMSFHVTDPPVA